MKTVTIDEVLSWNPCEEYTKERLRKLAGRRKKMSGLQILALKIPVADRLWAILWHGFLSNKDLRLFACDCAEHVLGIFEKKYPEDKRPQECIETARRFAYGLATEKERDAARDAAGDAAGDAAWDAARAAGDAWAAAGAAAGDAAWAAAWAAAGAAAGDAAWDAARAAAGAAAWAKEEAWQVKRLKRYLEDKP